MYFLAQKRLDREELEKNKKSKWQSYIDQDNDEPNTEEKDSKEDSKHKNKSRYII